MKFEDRMAAAKARLARAKETLQKNQPARVERRELAEVEREAEEAERDELYEQLLDRVEAARTAHPNGAFEGLMVQCFPDTFVIRRNSKAHAAWRDATIRAAAARARNEKAADAAAIDRRYAIECIYDWNGRSDFDTDVELAKKLNEFLTENAAIVSPITDVAGKLAGVFAEERSKSG